MGEAQTPVAIGHRHGRRQKQSSIPGLNRFDIAADMIERVAEVRQDLRPLEPMELWEAGVSERPAQFQNLVVDLC